MNQMKILLKEKPSPLDVHIEIILVVCMFTAGSVFKYDYFFFMTLI